MPCFETPIYKIDYKSGVFQELLTQCTDSYTVKFKRLASPDEKDKESINRGVHDALRQWCIKLVNVKDLDMRNIFEKECSRVMGVPSYFGSGAVHG